MSPLPSSVAIREVGTREGFQFEKGAISTDRKIELVDALSETGVKHIQVTSFVSPKWVPQMADADEITARFRRAPGVKYDALFLNDRGLERALVSGKYDFLGHLNLYASDAFSRRNTNKAVTESTEAIPGRIALDEKHNIPVRVVGITAAFGCNYEGDIPLERLLERVETVIEIAAEHGHELEMIKLSDTMGWAHPLQMKRTIAAVQDRWPGKEIALHLHDTRATAMANACAALELGVRDFDSSVAGLGGCPFASHKGAAGNICTEDLVFVCEEMGISTGIDLEKMIECAQLAEEIVGHELPGKLMKGGSLATRRQAIR
jgi:hydroxymethylglutaryl-CoA lyase